MIDTIVLRSKVLEMALQGKLTEQLPEDGSAEELYSQIQEDRKSLELLGKIKKGKQYPDITIDDIPFEIPQNWKWVHFEDISYAIGNKENQVQTRELSSTGTIPVVSQGELLVDGYCEDFDKQIVDLPLIMFGDHTRNVKYIDFPFVIGADGTKFHKCIVANPRYFYYWMLNAASRIDSRGYARHYARLKKILFSLPPIKEQERIVKKIDDIFSLLGIIDDLQEQFFDDQEVLKGKLIEAGIRGKLTEQLPEDGTAEELYRQIQEEKKTLVKEGRIKKGKKLPEIAVDEIPFKIPQSWKWVRLGSVLNEVIVPQRDKPKHFDGDIPWCRIEDADGDFMSKSHSNQKVSQKTVDEMNLRIFPTGTVLSACSGGSIGRILITTTELCTNQTFNGLVCNEGLYNRYLFHFLKNSIGRLKRMGSGAAMEYVSQKKIGEMLIPLPPLNEQKRIVEEIDKMMAICG